jgi:aspartate aminotransferase/aminotransferase
MRYFYIAALAIFTAHSVGAKKSSERDMSLIAKRMANIDASGIRKMFDMSATMKNPINLSIGQPDFDVPDELKTIAIQAIQAGFNRYTQSQGLAELNETIARFLTRSSGGVYTPEATMACSGVSGALLLLILAVVDPGDEVIFPDPYFVLYKSLTNLAGGKPVMLDTYPDFQLDPDKLEAAITPKTKMIIINSPSNPTGAVYSEESLKAVAEIARKRNILVVSDEIYRGFCYDEKYYSIANAYPERTVVIDGLSKSAAMTGWRIGFAAGPKEIIHEMIKLQQYTFVCAPSFAQKAAVRAFELENTYSAEYAARRDLVYTGLRDAGYELTKPGGAFYVFPKCPVEENRFIEMVIARNCLIVPGSVFSEKKGYFRVSFAVDEKILKQGISLLGDVLRELK